MTQKVRITHPELGTAEVMPSSAHVWTERGWSIEETEGNPENEVPNNETPEAARRSADPSVSPSPLPSQAESDVTAPSSSTQNTAQA